VTEIRLHCKVGSRPVHFPQSLGFRAQKLREIERLVSMNEAILVESVGGVSLANPGETRLTDVACTEGQRADLLTSQDGRSIFCTFWLGSCGFTLPPLGSAEELGRLLGLGLGIPLGRIFDEDLSVEGGFLVGARIRAAVKAADQLTTPYTRRQPRKVRFDLKSYCVRW